MGVVRAILNRMASVYLYDDGQEVDVPCRYVEPTPPSKYDKVWSYELWSRLYSRMLIQKSSNMIINIHDFCLRNS